jgi:lysyl-tRNA synthetase, class I
MSDNYASLLDSRSWPVAEARRLAERFERAPPQKGHVLFETGYGPSGLPHIGTFAEVFRTTLVRNAFAKIYGLPTRLFAFSDDMDGLRRVPDNIPNPDSIRPHLGKPLTEIPDPFGTAESYGHHMNGKLRDFLDGFGFEYEFVSATECYRSGRFDAALLEVLRHHDEIAAVILPTLGAERRATYSPILPISPRSGRVLQVPLVARDADAGTVAFRDEDGSLIEVPVTGGHCKLQWRPDWAMRWFALGVDYEMYGKDLTPSADLSGRICRILGGRPPEGFAYEMFLDEQGQKISKSKGNGLTAEEWLRYGPRESLALFMYQQPRRAKRLYFDVIPRSVDEYLALCQKYPEQSEAERYENPVWHIHGGNPPAVEVPLTYGVLLNLASVCNTEEPAVLWGFISRYVPGASPETLPKLDELVGCAINYYRDFVKPAKRYRAPIPLERAALAELADELAALPAGAEAEEIQTVVYEVGKRHDFASLRDWFRALYETLLGQSQGPRMGSFIALYGLAETVALIRTVLAGETPTLAEAAAAAAPGGIA